MSEASNEEQQGAVVAPPLPLVEATVTSSSIRTFDDALNELKRHGYTVNSHIFASKKYDVKRPDGSTELLTDSSDLLLWARQELVPSPVVSRTPQTEAENDKPVDAKQPSTFEIWLPDGQFKTYESVGELQTDLTRGVLNKRYRARVKSPNETSETTSPENWVTIDELSKKYSELQKIIRPKDYYMRKYILYGVLGAIGLKLVDTTITFLIADKTGKLFLFWLLTLACIFGTKWLKFWPIVIYFYVMYQMGGHVPNLFIAALAAGLVGAIFGVPSGALVGTVVGHIQSKKLSRTADVDDEGVRPYLIGIVLPVAFLATALPFYVFWLTPKMAEWLA